jgi:DNA-binding HxlR family transcriptional regulator
VKQPPTDADILAVLRQWNRTTTSVVRSVLVQQFDMRSISTPWVLRQLKRLERENKVRRVEQSTWKTQYVWSAL